MSVKHNTALSMIEMIILLIMGIAYGVLCADSNYGYFWQITDVHYDANYSQHGLGAYKCHQRSLDTEPSGQGNLTNMTTYSETPGMFGDPVCDSPWSLVTSAVEGMRRLAPDVDFIIWTGDSVAHVPDSQLTESKVFQGVIQNVTDFLLQTFPKTPLYPTIGNHDSLPANLVPPHLNDKYYTYMARYGHWERMLKVDGNSLKTFMKAGYYSTRNSHGLWVIGLNTMLWFQRNTLLERLNFTQSHDPGGQLEWLKTQLEIIKSKKEKALLTGHAPPGTGYGWSVSKPYYVEEYNRKLLQIAQNFSDVIAAMIFGHEHTDRWHIVYDETGGVPAFPVFSAPSVTPGNKSAPGHNPAIRLYQYSRTTGQIVDYKQYYLNLSAANAHQQADWRLEYSPTEAYEIPDITPTSLQGVVHDFKKPQSEKFRQFVLYMSVSNVPMERCTEDCKQQAICGILNLDLDLLRKCFSNETVLDVWFRTTKDRTKAVVLYTTVYGLVGSAAAAVTAVAFIVGAVLYYRRWRARTAQPKMQYSLLLSDEDTELEV